MTDFLLDTNICIFFNKGVAAVRDRLGSIGFERCAISEITYAEFSMGWPVAMPGRRTSAPWRSS